MKLKSAARYFDTDTVTDGYTGALLFKAQFSSYEQAAPDGSFQRRRVVSVAPGILPATRRVVTVQGMRWIMGELVTDAFRDKPIRQTSAAKEATDLFTLLTPAQAALKSAGTSIYGHKQYLKDTVNSVTDSNYDPQYEVFFGITENLKAGYFLKSAQQYLHIRILQYANEGYWVAVSDELATNPATDAEVTATFAGVYDPVTEETTSQPVTYTGRGVLDSYDSRRVDNINIKVGDVLLICLANETTDVPAVGHKITAPDLLTGAQVAYQVVSPGIDPAKAHYEIQLRK